MGFPAYLLLFLGMAILLIGVCFVYYQIYKRRINRALSEITDQQKPMPSPFNVAISLTIIFLLFAILMSFVIGFGMGYRSLDQDTEGQIDVNSFYAEIMAIEKDTNTGADTIAVKGIELNEESYRNEFTFVLYEGLMIEWHDQQLSVSDLDVGDLVSVTLLTDLLGVEDVFKIQLLDDEM